MLSAAMSYCSSQILESGLRWFVQCLFLVTYQKLPFIVVAVVEVSVGVGVSFVAKVVFSIGVWSWGYCWCCVAS